LGLPEYEWDPVKAEANEFKHDMACGDATLVFDDPTHFVELSDQTGHGEVRWVAVGRMGAEVVAIVFTMQGNRRRIISARRSSRDERRKYGRSETTS
jgi:uncharacterized DUF497 family protein